MRTLLLGRQGQVGSELLIRLAAHGEVTAPARAVLDVSDLHALRRAVVDAAPDLIVNATAWNDVDGAERDPKGAYRLNRDVPALLGEEAARRGALFVHFSTDFVFDGKGDRPYREEDRTNPSSIYGSSKRAGEEVLEGSTALVFRTAWVWSLTRKSFVSTMLSLARSKEELSVVDDQVGNPTYAADLAEAVATLVTHEAARAGGLFHLAGGGSVSRYEFARAIFALDPRKDEHVLRAVHPVKSEAFPTPAVRPKHAPLDCEKAARVFGVRLRGLAVEALAAGLGA